MDSRLTLEFHAYPDPAHTTIHVREMTPPWKVVRGFPLPTGEALVHLNNVSGGILGADTMHLDVQLRPGARAQITTTGATRVYRCRGEAEPARSITQVRIAEQALLEYLPDSLIPYRGSRYIQRTQIHLDAGAGLFCWDILAPGRASAGEMFAYDLLDSRFEIIACRRPIMIDNYRLKPTIQPLDSTALLGGFSHLANFYICRQGVPCEEWLHYEEALNELAAKLNRPGETLWGASALASDGLVVRGLAASGRHLPAGLLCFWHTAKRLLYGQDPVVPRKIY